MIQRTYSELNMDMLVFENRNQSYGAFEIRRVYNSHIRNSLLIAIFFSAGLFGGLYLINKNVSASAIASIKPIEEVFISPEALETMTYHPKPAMPITKAPVVKAPVIAVENPSYKPVSDVVNDPVINTPTDQVATQQTGSTGIADGNSSIHVGPSNSPEIEIPIDVPVDFAEAMPTFEGGDAALKKFLSNNLIYPNKMIDQNISGKVYVSFVIEKDGTISMVQLVKGVAEELDAEALRVISKMPSWTPGKQGGHPVRVKRIIPISFSLN